MQRKPPTDACLLSCILGLWMTSLAACSSGGLCESCQSPQDGSAALPDVPPPADLRHSSSAGDGSSLDLGARDGENCTDARQLPFLANRAVLNDTTLGRRNDTSSRCGGADGDTVYKLKVVEPYLFVEVVPVGAWSPHVYLKTYCESSELVADTCATSAFWDSHFPTGSYFLIVDGDGTGGDYKLTVEQRPTALGMGDTCKTPQLLTFTGDTATVTAYTRGSTGGPKVRCASAAGRDVYSLVLGAPQKIEATVTALTPGFYPVLALRGGGTACTSGGDLECVAATGSIATLAPISPVDTGSYTLVVTGTGSTTGQYRLDVKVRP